VQSFGSGAALSASCATCFQGNRLAIIGLAMLLALILLASIGPRFSPYDPYVIALTDKHLPPSLHHPLGTDFFGRDVFTRLMYGLRTSLAIAVLVQSVSVVIGVTLGLLSGYYGRILDMILMRITDAFLAFPPCCSLLRSWPSGARILQFTTGALLQGLDGLRPAREGRGAEDPEARVCRGGAGPRAIRSPHHSALHPAECGQHDHRLYHVVAPHPDPRGGGSQFWAWDFRSIHRAWAI
jgi:hypothetical protein